MSVLKVQARDRNAPRQRRWLGKKGPAGVIEPPFRRGAHFFKLSGLITARAIRLQAPSASFFLRPVHGETGPIPESLPRSHFLPPGTKPRAGFLSRQSFFRRTPRKRRLFACPGMETAKKIQDVGKTRKSSIDAIFSRNVLDTDGQLGETWWEQVVKSGKV